MKRAIWIMTWMVWGAGCAGGAVATPEANTALVVRATPAEAPEETQDESKAIADRETESKSEVVPEVIEETKPDVVRPKWLELRDVPLEAELAASAGYVERGQWVAAKKELIKALAKGPRLDIEIMGHTLLGRANDRLKDSKAADVAYKKVLDLYGNGTDAIKALLDLGGDDDTKKARLARALLSAAEARFYFAEQKRKAADNIKYPKYTGSGAKDDVMKHINTKLADWIKKKRPAIQEAEQEYLKIVQMEPSAQPKWVVASAERVGTLWSTFVDEFRSAPIPNEWKQKGSVPGAPDLTWEQVRTTYLSNIDEVSEAQKEQARTAFKMCHEWASRYGIQDDTAKRCKAWLDTNK